MVQQVCSRFRVRQCSTVASLAVITAAMRRQGSEAEAYSCAAACKFARTPVAILTWAEACFPNDGGMGNIEFPADR